jgi:hypothetical protein
MNPQDRWCQVWHILCDLIPQEIVEISLHHPHVLWPTKGGAGKLGLPSPKQILMLEKPCAKEIDAAIDEWKKGQPLILPSDEHKVCFYCRVHSAERFAELHTMLGKIPDRKVLADPLCEPRIVVAYLLTDWWYEHGYKEYFYSMLSGLHLQELM